MKNDTTPTLFRVSLMVVVWLGLSTLHSHSQSRLLDDFEDLGGWRAIPSEGAKLKLGSGEGKSGKAMVMEFDLRGVYGYTIAQKDFVLDLPSNYRFTFDLRADGPVNNFEFKLLDEEGSVFWIKKLNFHHPKEWEKQSIKKRHITFAWGPSRGGEIRKVVKIEFVVSSGTGGMGKVFIDNFRFEPIDDELAQRAQMSFDASAGKSSAHIDEKGMMLRNWTSTGQQAWLSFNFNYLKELGGLVIDWVEGRFATAYDVQISDDGKEWVTAYTVTQGNGGRDYLFIPEKDARVLRINLHRSTTGAGYGIAGLEVKGPEFSSTANAFFSSIAKGSSKGHYPKFFLNQQCYWTIVGTSGDTKEALINELGAIEVDQRSFSLEPFLFRDGRLLTWSDVDATPSLEKGYLPIPSVRWNMDGLKLTVRAFSAGSAGSSELVATYRIHNESQVAVSGKLFLALRPFQVNPPWQWLNKLGGVARLDSIRFERGVVFAQDKAVIPISRPSGFGATSFDGGDIIEYLQEGKLPTAQQASDVNGFASAALGYDFNLPPGSSREFHVVVPFHGYKEFPGPPMGEGSDLYVRQALALTVAFWEAKLAHIRIRLPASAQSIVNTIKSNLAYIFINRDGPGIQPGSRSYERSWIRDGSLTSTALLEMGVRDEVREYIDWYARYQYPDGKIPCVVDHRGADPTNEHDSHGQFIYVIMQYFRFTQDTTWLRGKFDQVVKTVRFIQSLRARRMTELYTTATPEQRACYGLVPESISHEGYSAKPMHSYWDNFFILRGLKDATSMAAILDERGLETEFAAERDDFRKDLYASIRLAMKNKTIDFIPGCVELGDFDATSTTIGIQPVNELGRIPEPELHNTFERYYERFRKRRENEITWKDYTPYENRVIGTFVLLGQKRRAHEALEFFMKDRRPAAWNQWGEVVHRDPATPQFIGDMPHTWCGSDFIRSVRSMFVYEREEDDALVVGAGVADAWVQDPSGVEVSELPTYHGSLSYSIKKTGNTVAVRLSGSMRMPAGFILLKSPLEQGFVSATLNGAPMVIQQEKPGHEITIKSLPALVELRYE